MKVILNCHVPFMLAHGGAQVQIEQTKKALENLGVAVEPLRWWDERQSGDVLHHFGRIPTSMVVAAQQKGMKVVMTAIMSALGARPAWQLLLQAIAIKTLGVVSPRTHEQGFNWASFLMADACIALTPLEASQTVKVFGAPANRVHVITNGVEDVFLQDTLAERGPWLVCTAAIIKMKQVLKLAEMAVYAKTPVWIIGKGHSETDGYVRRFVEFARRNQSFVRYEGAISDRERMAGIYRGARGFVLLSQWEGLSLSALEAAGCRCPLLLSDLPWARGAFKERATYCPHDASLKVSARILRSFYDAAPTLPVPPTPVSWNEVGGQLKALYESLVTSSR